jgi:CheY-like chemotaxis protein
MVRPSPVRLFYSYAHEDEPFRIQLSTHLALLRKRGLIEEWHDRKILAGERWDDQIMSSLLAADIVLLLISSDFIASDYCFGKEMTTALELEKKKPARVIPVIVRSVDWHGAPFGHLQALPDDAKPVATWDDRDEAWTKVATGIRLVVESMSGGRKSSTFAFSEKAPPPPSPADGEAIRHAVDNFAGRLDTAAREKGVERSPEAVRAIGDALATMRDPKTVLWVDDHPSNNRSEASALFALQVDVEAVRSTEEAMHRLRTGRPDIDLVITDWNRDPQLQAGVPEGLRLLREMRDAGIRLPVICYHGEFEPGRGGARDEAIRALGGIGATPNPVQLLRWCGEALGRGDDEPPSPRAVFR